jgi:hypothetical protein
LNVTTIADRHDRTVVTVPISSLLPGESPRLEGHNQEHVARLAEIDTPLPPILVERGTMRVVDGMHRIFAAVLRGRQEIEVEFFDGEREDAFLRSVEANVEHGFPLSQADRRAAAARIMMTHPHMSDRAIARLAGMGAKTVAAIRRSTAAVPQLNARVGRDGKVRPLSNVAGRQRAADVLAHNPGASLREVARLAGVSPATVSDVRSRLARGEAPSASRNQNTETATVVSAQARVRRARQPRQDPASVLDKLLRDPSLRNNEEGRNLLRLLRNNAIGMRQWTDLAAAVPPHCGGLVVELAQRYAELWLEFSRELDERVQSVVNETVGQATG